VGPAIVKERAPITHLLGRPRYPHCAGAPGPPGRDHDDGLHPRPQPGPSCGPEPGRPDVPGVMAVGRTKTWNRATGIHCRSTRDSAALAVGGAPQHCGSSDAAGSRPSWRTTLHRPAPPGWTVL